MSYICLCLVGHVSQVRLEVRAVGLNFRDVLMILGEYPGDTGPLGVSASGVVTAGHLTNMEVGDAVFGKAADGALASFAWAESSGLAALPTSLSFEEGCSMPTLWVSVHASLEVATLHARGQLVVNAAAGGIGLTAIEMSRFVFGSVRADTRTLALRLTIP